MTKLFNIAFNSTNVKKILCLIFLFFSFCCQLGSVSQYMFWKETMITSTKKSHSCFVKYKEIFLPGSHIIFRRAPPFIMIHGQSIKFFVSAQWLFNSFCVCIFFWLFGMISKPNNNKKINEMTDNQHLAQEQHDWKFNAKVLYLSGCCCCRNEMKWYNLWIYARFITGYTKVTYTQIWGFQLFINAIKIYVKKRNKNVKICK